METSSSEKAKEFRALNEAKNQRVLEMLEKKRFGVSEVQIKTPEKAIIYPTRICSSVEKVLWNLWKSEKRKSSMYPLL